MDIAKEISSVKRKARTPGGSLVSTIFLVLQLLPMYTASQIAWLPNVEWNNESNWDGNVVPQNGSHLVFPVELRLSVGLPTKNSALELAGIELPRDGVIALPESGYIKISEAQPTTKSARWTYEGPLLWVDPENWLSERRSPAVPHLEQIPCQGDTVILPKSENTFSIQLPKAKGTLVKGIRVPNDGDLESWEWADLKEHKEFDHGPKTVEYAGLRSCVECPCQQEATGKEILEEVCETKGARCQQLECEYPVYVEGHCCSYCGGRVVLPEQTSLSLANDVTKIAMKSYGSVSWYVRRKWDKTVEILLAGREGYSQMDTISAVESIKLTLQEQGMKLVASEVTGAEMRGSKAAAFLGPFFGTLLFLMVVVLGLMPYYGYPLPQIIGESWNGLRIMVATTTGTGAAAASTQPNVPRKPFRFAKFENAPEAEVELAGPSGSIAIVDADDEVDEEEGGGRFANPLYRSVRRGPEEQTFSSLKKIHDEEADEEIDLGIDP